MTKSTIGKLVIFNYLSVYPATYAEYVDRKGNIVRRCWEGITTERAEIFPIKEMYEGKAAAVKLWEMQFDKLADSVKAFTGAVYPDIASHDKTKLKPPHHIANIATNKVLAAFGVICPRCGGSGNYAKSVAYTKVDNGICHKCNGRKVVLPNPTKELLGKIKNHFNKGAKND